MAIVANNLWNLWISSVCLVVPLWVKQPFVRVAFNTHLSMKTLSILNSYARGSPV